MNMLATHCPLCSVCHAPLMQPPRRTPMSEAVGGPVCADCIRQKPYEEANTLLLGEPDGAPAFSIEFEVCWCRLSRLDELPRAWVLLSYGYLRTEDCSVDDEYKSPRYQSLHAFETVLPVLDTLKRLVDGCCGTHIHIACPRKRCLAEHFLNVFDPLLAYWSSHKHETLAFWGRSSAPHGNVRISERYDTLEFRLPCFRSAAQYRAVIVFCRQAGQLINGWLENVADSDAFGQYAPLVGDALLDLYQQASATALTSPTWLVRRPYLFRPL